VEPFAKDKDFYYTRFVTTVVAIVPAMIIEDFKKTYQFISDNVIPYSAKLLKVP